MKHLIATLLIVLLGMQAVHAVSYSVLDKRIASAEEFLAGDTSDYPAVLVTELEDILSYAQAVRADATSTQSTVNAAARLLYATLTSVEGKAGYAADDQYVMDGTYDEDRGFVHPGLLHTQADIDRIRQQIEDGDEFVTAAYAQLTSNEWAQSDRAVGGQTTVNRGGDDENYINASRAAAGAYMNALRWLISGNTAFAENAIGILNDWAATCTLVTGDSNWALAAGLTGYQFANAAELMRDYEGWAEEDFRAFQDWMRRVWYEPNMKFLRVRNGTWENTVGNKGLCPGHYWSNWGLCNALSAMSIGILCDDPYLYNQAVSFYKYNHYDGDDCWPDNIIDSVIYDNGCNEFIGILVPTVFEDERGPFGQLAQMQESGRDQGHAQMALGLAVDICQTAYNQGDDLFAYMDNRLAAGIEYQQAFNTQTEAFCATLPWMNFHYRDCRHMYYDSASWLMTAPSYSSRGTLRPFNERILGYYEGIKGIAMPYTTEARDELGYEVGGLGSTSGGYDHLGLTTLTCHRDAIEPALAPATLKGSIVYDGDTLSEQTELGGQRWTYVKATSNALPAGSTVTLLAQLPDSLIGTGTWLWGTAAPSDSVQEALAYETTSAGTALTVSPTRSGRYFAYYTNDAGVETTLAFTIAILGDCRPDSVTPTMTAYATATTLGTNTQETTVTDNTLTVLAGTKVLMQGVATSADWGYYEWETGQTTDTLSADYLCRSRDIAQIYTNPGGGQTRTTFHIDVVGVQPYAQVDSFDAQNTTEVAAFAGQTVALIPNTTTLYAAGTWVWYIHGDDGVLTATGDSTQILTIDSVADSRQYTVIHTYGSLATDTITYTVSVAQPASLSDGNYFIALASDTTQYLGIYSSVAPRFMTFDDTDADTYIWLIERDTDVDRYKFTATGNERYLNAAAASARLSTSSTYNAERHTYTLWAGTEADCYALQNAPYYDDTFFYTDSDGSGILYTDAEQISAFPFRITAVPAQYLTAISSAKADDTPVVATDYYSPAGTRIATPQRGINIVRTTTAGGTTSTSKILRP